MPTCLVCLQYVYLNSRGFLSCSLLTFFVFPILFLPLPPPKKLQKSIKLNWNVLSIYLINTSVFPKNESTYDLHIQATEMHYLIIFCCIHPNSAITDVNVELNDLK